MRYQIALIVIACSTLFSHRSDAQFVQQGPKLVGTGAVGNSNNQQVRSISLSADGNTAIVVRSTETYVWTRKGGVWTQQTRLVDAGVDSASLSADGNTAIVGISHDHEDTGAACVWTRHGDVWTQQGNKLVGSGAVGNAEQGMAVAISADGNTAIVGGPTDGNTVTAQGFTDNEFAGAVWVWTRNAGVWTQQGPKLIGASHGTGAQQGSFVSISADGNTAIVGGRSYYANTGPEGAWVWTRSGGVWKQQGDSIIGLGAVLGGYGSVVAPQGNPVSLSADGNTAIVGSPNDNGNIGAVWVFTRSGATWTQQGNKLVGSDFQGTSYQANSVSLSADGNTAIIAGYGDNSNFGAAWVWRRNGGVWTQQGTKLVGSGVSVAALQGNSVSISGDGNTAIAGGWGEAGPAWVWTSSGGTWTQQGDKLIGSGGSEVRAWQGSSVAISADGDTAIVGGIFDNRGVGAAWVWTRSGGVWTQQGTKLVGSNAGTGFSVYQGWAVAISADGNTAIVGGPTDGSRQDQVGAAWVWTRSGGVWTQQGNKLVGTGAVGISRQGLSVAISGDGNTAIVGGVGDNFFTGAAWIWTRSGGVWTQQGNKLVGYGAVTCTGPTCRGAGQGSAVALSADGNTAIVGGSGDNPFTPTGVSGFFLTQGAAWVWTRSGGVWRQQGDKLVGSGNFADLNTGTSAQGTSVALSGDGSTAIVGGSNGPGAAWVWSRNGATWTQQARLAQANVTGQGYSVSLSLDGNTAVVGGYLVPAATWIWTRSEGVWTSQGTRLDCSDTVGESYQGHSAYLSGDGNTVIVGRGADNDGAGAAWVFVSKPWRRRASITK